jgi:hypothetical protein
MRVLGRIGDTPVWYCQRPQGLGDVAVGRGVPSGNQLVVASSMHSAVPRLVEAVAELLNKTRSPTMLKPCPEPSAPHMSRCSNGWTRRRWPSWRLTSGYSRLSAFIGPMQGLLGHCCPGNHTVSPDPSRGKEGVDAATCIPFSCSNMGGWRVEDGLGPMANFTFSS